jgi:anti-sigma B factor antagonist
LAGAGSAPELSFDLAYHDEDVIVRVAGELDCFTAPVFDRFLEDLIDEGTLRLMVNLAGVSFADSHGLGPLVSAATHLRRREGRLAVCGARPCVARVLDLMGVADQLTPGPRPVAA